MSLEGKRHAEVSFPKEEEVLPVTGEFLVCTFENGKFRETLSKTARKMMKEGWETGFEVYKAVKGDKIKIFEFGRGEVSWRVTRSEESVKPEISEEMILVFSLHFHHNPQGSIYPSVGIESDLGALAIDRIAKREEALDITPVMTIGQVDKKGRVRLLCLQEQTIQPMTISLLVQIESDFEEVETQEDILNILRENGYKAEILTLTSDYSLPDSEQEKLRKFEFLPKVLKE